MEYSKEKTFLYDKLSDKICAYIKENGLKKGEKLPGERKMAEEWSVSRATLREAIKELQKQGILKTEVGKGTFVAEEIGSKQFSVKLASQNFGELFEIKTVLERYCLEKMTLSISEEKLDALEKIAVQMNVIKDVGIMPEELDRQFHAYLTACYGNKELSRMVSNLIEIYDEFCEEMKVYHDTEKFDWYSLMLETIPLHLEIVQKMRERDILGVLDRYDKITELDLKIYKCYI